MTACLTVEQRPEAPTFPLGTARDIAEHLRARRERGFSYITVRENVMEALAPAIEPVR